MLQSVTAQVIRDNRKTPKTTTDQKTTPVIINEGNMTLFVPQVVIYEHANFSGQSKSFGEGNYRFYGNTDLNDMSSSIKVPNGLVAVIYEHANDAGGYGIYIDLMEDCASLSVYDFNDKVSYLRVFAAAKPGYLYARNRMTNNEFVPGHWERERANGAKPDNSRGVVSPALTPQTPTSSTSTTVNGPTTTITSLGVQTLEGKSLWDMAMNDQMGVIGNNFRGREEIGSAAFQREFTGGLKAKVADKLGASTLNFWYPQRKENDHRPHFKRTLRGKVKSSYQVEIGEGLPDFDVNVLIEPSSSFQYLVNDAHTPLHNVMTRLGQEINNEPQGCPTQFTELHAEITEDYWPKGNRTFGRARFADLALMRTGKDMCVYGTWIYDKGHCCHPEIHPAEQWWWSDQQSNGRKFNLNVFCDASRRFLWRKQMDDGTKLKPWAEPPVKGLFAIAFEYTLPQGETLLGQTTRQFEAAYIQHYNLAEYPNADQTYKLVYNNQTLVSFIPHNNAFKVSFEHVGFAAGDPSKIRGFLVIETYVGRLTQIATAVTIWNGNTPLVIKLPPNSTPGQAPELYEDKFFKKEEGHYLFTITETSLKNEGVKDVGKTIEKIRE